MNRSSFTFRGVFLYLLPCVFLLFSGVPAKSAGLPQYCQYPPYVLQSVLPSVTLLVSNSVSMLQFAYGDNVTPTNPCDNQANACGGFDPTKDYYGLFDNNYWYRGTTGGSGGFTRAGLVGGTDTNPTGRTSNDWHGNFLNWLTSRRVDVMRKVLTGGTGDGTQLCGAGIAEWKKFTDNRTFTPINQTDQIVQFPKSTNCAGTLLGSFVLIGGGNPSYNIRNQSVGATSGIIQEVTPRASLGIAFYNSSDGQGASLDPQVDGSNIPISAYRNRIDTPSRFNGLTVGAPLGEALWTIVGSYAMIGTQDSSYGPRYHNLDYNPGKDPYWFHGGPAQCVKGNVIVISDGEPCNDGNLPGSYSGVPGGSILNYAENPINCDVNGVCSAAPTFGFPTATSIPSCASGGSTGGFEDVALFAHTNDLRGPTFGVNNLDRMQNLDIYVIRAFGSDNSNLLKYGAINGSFELSLGDNTTVPGKILPRPGSFVVNGGPGSAYFEAQDGHAIREALDDIFENLLRRATSGTAASVLASGEGSGANIVQAVFYPRRRFFDEVIDWTGTLNNFWYFVDPFFGGASIREETSLPVSGNSTLNLQADNTVEFFFDPVRERTMANRYGNDANGVKIPGTKAVVFFEEIKPIWEAGKFLHVNAPALRTIFTAVDNGARPAHVSFDDAYASVLRSYLAVVSDTEAANIIRYVRGYDDTNGDGVIDFRQRTVPYPANSPADNTVWKLGDIINSTPKVVSVVPLNTYQKTYNDLTYKSYIESSGYRNRGMVFVGANDGMLHAFKLGKLEFPGDSAWSGPSGPGALDRARLRNLDPSTALGSERWAFVPKNTLPYLQAMLDPNYCHLYYVDLAPQLFDASVPESATDNASRTAASWRTILIGGMRFGGACRDNTATCTDCVKSPVSGNIGLSSYFAIDVTNPEDPTVLWEFTDPALGFATTGPAIVRINTRNASNDPDRSTNGKWYAVFGSGPTGPISNRQFLGRSDQTLKLFIVDLRTGTLVRTIDRFDGSTISNAFAGSMINSTADVNLDYSDDALYFGYVKENSGAWNRGGVIRLLTKDSADPNDWVAGKLIETAGPVTSSVVRLQNNVLHTNWLFFGTGRYYFVSPSALDDPSERRRLYGVKDPCFNSQNRYSPTCPGPVDEGAELTLADTPPTSEPSRGWYIQLDIVSSVAYDNTAAKSYLPERVITDPLATTSGVVFFTTYRPYADDCAIGGRTFLWAVQYNTGGVPLFALRGRALMQVSTASVEQLDLATAFSHGDATLNRGGRRSYSLEGVPPMAQGLSLLSPPPPVKRILHMIER